MKFDTRIQDRGGRIQIEGSTFRYQREDGETAQGGFSIEPLEPGCYSVLVGGRSYRVAEGARGEMLVNGVPLAVEVFDPRSLRGRQAGASSEGRQEVAALMPGKVVRVLVEAGDSVEAGQGLVVIEAMKMQNEVRSPKRGIVERLLVSEGQTINAG